MVSTSPRVILPRPVCIEQQLLHFGGDHHHVGAEGVHELAGGVGLEAGAGLVRGGRGPAHGVLFAHAGQLHHAAVLAQGLAEALKAVLVVHVHAAGVGRDAQDNRR